MSQYDSLPFFRAGGMIEQVPIVVRAVRLRSEEQVQQAWAEMINRHLIGSLSDLFRQTFGVGVGVEKIVASDLGHAKGGQMRREISEEGG